jgi:hypothetical protein
MTELNLEPVRGGCLCGAVRFEVRATHRDGYFCHCRMCQLAFGNTRAALVSVRKVEVSWTTKPPEYFFSSSFARRGFCSRCGTPLSFEYLSSENMDLTIGSLDTPAAFTPIAHFAVESRIANWHATGELREERLDENVQIMSRWKQAYGEDCTPGVQATRST